VDIAQDEADRIDNRVDTFGKAFLGLALGCARCHDHKFDAVSAADYYAIAGMVMASSYRQVPFEALEANARVARQLADADAEAQRTLLPLVASLVGEDAATIDAADAPAAYSARPRCGATRA
jgi:cytochrome c553